ncbi:minor allergen Can f 2-like [Oryctolagus cuniculus]|uniref:minor allergen Can f 2-like n=1 Tax=Oryctolagus cuniculus TaxID=9986 RepID=UPI003879FEC0
MRVLLLTVGLALLCHRLQAQGQQASALSGSWYTGAQASNNSAFLRPGGPFRVYVDTLDIIDGNMHAVLLLREDGQCKRVSVTAFKTDVEGEFLLDFRGHSKLYVVEAEPDSFLVLYKINQYEGQTSVLAELLVREPVTQDRILARFGSICEELGLSREQILLLDHKDRCQELRTGTPETGN